MVLPRQAGGPRASLLTAARPLPGSPPLARRPARALLAPLPIPGSRALRVGKLMSFQYCRTARRRLDWWLRSKGEANDASLTGVDGTDALEGRMDCGREGREERLLQALVVLGGELNLTGQLPGKAET